MKCLAFDTAAGACSAAVLVKDEIVAQRSEALARGHTEVLIPMIQSVMADAGLSFAQLDLIGVTVGPGAFTGIRIGLATARGLALAAELPVAGVTSLAALAATVDGDVADDREIVVAIDTKRGDFYAQRFTGSGIEMSAPAVVDAEKLAKLVAADDSPKATTIVSDASDEAIMALTVPAGTRRAPARFADPAWLARLALEKWRADNALPPDPFYLRPPEAKLPARRGLRP